MLSLLLVSGKLCLVKMQVQIVLSDVEMMSL